jgi:hypothetical protein
LQDVNGSWVTNGIVITIDTSTGIENWPNEALDGIYSWGNTLNGADGLLSSSYPGIQVGRDLYNDTPKPGYTPYTYPYPLTFVYASSTNVPVTTNSPPPVTTNNTPTNGIAPPSGLHIVP